MRDSLEFEALKAEARKIYEEISNANVAQRKLLLIERLEVFQDPKDQDCVEVLVQNWLSDTRTLPSTTASHGLDVQWFFPIASFVVAFLIAFFEFHLSLIWSFFCGLLALAIVAIVTKKIMRSFDSKWHYRRNFTFTLLCGLALLMPSGVSMYVDVQNAGASWGGPPATQVIVIWVVALLVTGGFALMEYLNNHEKM